MMQLLLLLLPLLEAWRLLQQPLLLLVLLACCQLRVEVYCCFNANRQHIQQLLLLLPGHGRPAVPVNGC